jgi:hypothetical protein
MLLIVYMEEIAFIASIVLAAILLLVLVVGLLSMSSAEEKPHTSTICLRMSLAVCGFLGIVFSSRYSTEITARVAFQHEVHPAHP